MARIRSVHPGLFKDEAFMELSMAARVLVIGIWTLADDHGVFEWKPRLIRAEIFPGENVEIEPLLDELMAQHCIQRFNDSGRTYAVIRNFCLYQRPRMPSYRHPFPQDVSNYAGIERRKAEELVQASSRKPSSKTTDDASPTAGPPQPNGSPTEKSPHRRGEKGRGREEESQTDRSESVVVVVPDAKAEMTTTTTVSKSASQGKAGLGRLLGRPLPADWVPDAPLCEKVLADFGMSVEDISAELPAFHALNVQNGTLSQDWHATFYLFAKRWKERQARSAPRVELSKAPTASKPFEPSEKDWDLTAKIFAQTGRWSHQFGSDPLSGRCRCPISILQKHGIDPTTGEKLGPIVPAVEGSIPQ
jgi:hypothetical protein